MAPPSSTSFGKTCAGEPVDLFALKNRTGMEVTITNFGATIVSLSVPDRDGKSDDVVLGYDNLQDYERSRFFLGGTIGRYANRIAGARFSLGGKVHCLHANDDANTLHGGIRGFHLRVWVPCDVSTSSESALQLSYESKDGEEGFPGSLSATVTFSLPLDRNELRIDYVASTYDQPTVVNLTNHSYFNLRGAGNPSILEHQLKLCAQRFTPVNARQIPTGELRDVMGTPFDFRQAVAIGKHIADDDEQLKFCAGYDHNWVLDKQHPGSFDLAAEAYDIQSGRSLVIHTTEPGIQFYSGNFLDGSVQGKHRRVYGNRSAFCLETQHFPDSPNHAAFPSTVLNPGQRFHSTTINRFLIR